MFLQVLARLLPWKGRTRENPEGALAEAATLSGFLCILVGHLPRGVRPFQTALANGGEAICRLVWLA
jgi:hypothetical protein